MKHVFLIALATLSFHSVSFADEGANDGVWGMAPFSSCMAFFQGFVFNEATGQCEARSASGCSNPFMFTELADCQQAMHLN